MSISCSKCTHVGKMQLYKEICCQNFEYMLLSLYFRISTHQKLWLQPNLTSSATLGWTLTKLLPQINMERLTPVRLSRKLAAWHAHIAAEWLVRPLPKEPLRSCSKKARINVPGDASAPCLVSHFSQMGRMGAAPWSPAAAPLLLCLSSDGGLWCHGSLPRESESPPVAGSAALLCFSPLPSWTQEQEHRGSSGLVLIDLVRSSWVKPRTGLGLDCNNYKFAIRVI
jgi:hypothetical protein